MKNLYLFVFLLVFTACTPNKKQEEVKAKPTIVNLYNYDVESRIKKLGFELKAPSKPVANYVHCVRTGNLVFMAGKGPVSPDGERITGKLGEDLTIEQGYEASKFIAISQLGVLKAEIGDLNKVK